MAPDPDQLRRLTRERQRYFLPYYREVVARHPEGISAADAKAEVAEHLRRLFEIDMSDPTQSGLNISTGRSRADQWANNLVSNALLDDYMIVVRSTRATLYPGVADNSQTPAPLGRPLAPGQVNELNDRHPVPIAGGSSSVTFQRSLQLAEHVRQMNRYACAVNDSACVPFNGRSGQPYVEVHHIIPMAMQAGVTTNLDRVSNMAPVCPRCHACLHRGAAAIASEVLDRVLRWFESIHGRTFPSSNADLALGTGKADLLRMYGLMTS